jgi:hypothetical protein
MAAAANLPPRPVAMWLRAGARVAPETPPGELADRSGGQGQGPGTAKLNGSGCGAAWLARLSGGQEVPGSNPGTPTERMPIAGSSCLIELVGRNGRVHGITKAGGQTLAALETQPPGWVP